MPPTGIFVVKESYYQITLRGKYVVRVDHISNIVWLPDTHERVSNTWKCHLQDVRVDHLKRECNVAFFAGYYRDAISL
jgi:hypothetical protein